MHFIINNAAASYMYLLDFFFSAPVFRRFVFNYLSFFNQLLKLRTILKIKECHYHHLCVIFDEFFLSEKWTSCNKRTKWKY